MNALDPAAPPPRAAPARAGTARPEDPEQPETASDAPDPAGARKPAGKAAGFAAEFDKRPDDAAVAAGTDVVGKLAVATVKAATAKPAKAAAGAGEPHREEANEGDPAKAGVVGVDPGAVPVVALVAAPVPVVAPPVAVVPEAGAPAGRPVRRKPEVAAATASGPPTAAPAGAAGPVRIAVAPLKAPETGQAKPPETGPLEAAEDRMPGRAAGPGHVVHQAATAAMTSDTGPAAPASARAEATGGAGLTLTPAAAPHWHLSAAPADQPAVRAPAIPATVQPQAVLGQITLAIGKAEEKRIEIRLDPPELGRVQIHLTHSERGLQAVVLADRPETQDFLRRNGEALARDLNAAGYDNVSLDFAAGGQSAQRDPEGQLPAGGFAVAATAAAAPDAVAARTATQGGLDIRL